MNAPRLLPLAVSAAALCTAAPVAHAAGPKTPDHKYHFTFELEGKQTTKWSLHHRYDASLGGCDADEDGSGRETIRFHGRAKDVVSFDGMGQPIFVSKDGNGSQMDLAGKVTRHGSMTVGKTPRPEECPDGVTPVEPPKPDCGTKSLAGMRVEPTYRYRKASIVISPVRMAKATFNHCPVEGSTFPNGLLDQIGTGTHRVSQHLPYHDLFHQGKNILIGTGVDHGGDDEAKYTTRIRWILSIRRTKVEDLH